MPPSHVTFPIRALQNIILVKFVHYIIINSRDIQLLETLAIRNGVLVL